MRGTLTGQRYVDDILRSHVGPFLNGLPGAIFKQDNARPHTARVAQDFLRHFQTLPWPARFVPCRAHVGSAKTADAIVSLCWNHADWGRIVFSDESHFHLCPDNHRRRVWRQRAEPAFTIVRHKGPQQRVMVWGAISFEVGSLWLSLETHSTLVRRRHFENCFATVPFAVPGPYFQQDNAKPHTTRVAINCLQLITRFLGQPDRLIPLQSSMSGI
ncbi:transposable element Tc1 transposase [Trichonephila clavipes]|nr:transposable element Tc1 transposase [Trichonephila clavipes]